MENKKYSRVTEESGSNKNREDNGGWWVEVSTKLFSKVGECHLEFFVGRSFHEVGLMGDILFPTFCLYIFSFEKY